MIRALVADDEPVLREHLVAMLAQAWPGLTVVAQARHGREAIERVEALQPEVVFLDIHMPGLNGVEAARQIGRRAHIVFITAYEQYAVQAFEQGAVDYLVKPVQPARLAETVQRLQQRVGSGPAATPAALEAVLAQLAQHLGGAGARGVTPPLRWIHASVGSAVRLIPVEQVHYLRSDEKYTLVVWEGGEGLIRRSIRELAEALDPASFAQIHRSTIVNLHQVAQVHRGPNETAEVQLKGRSELLPVSRSYLHQFRQM